MYFFSQKRLKKLQHYENKNFPSWDSSPAQEGKNRKKTVRLGQVSLELRLDNWTLEIKIFKLLMQFT